MVDIGISCRAVFLLRSWYSVALGTVRRCLCCRCGCRVRLPVYSAAEIRPASVRLLCASAAALCRILDGCRRSGSGAPRAAPSASKLSRGAAGYRIPRTVRACADQSAAGIGSSSRRCGDPVQDPRRVAPISCGRVGIGSSAHRDRLRRSECRAHRSCSGAVPRLCLCCGPSGSSARRSAAAAAALCRILGGWICAALLPFLQKAFKL